MQAEEADRSCSAERMLALAQRYKYDARVFMLEDLEAGKPLVLDWLSSYVYDR